MAQPGNDNQKDGIVSDYPDNVHGGVYAGGDNYTPLSMTTEEDGDEAERGQTPYTGKWLYGDKPGIE